jgi:RHS repeat-associated protein
MVWFARQLLAAILSFSLAVPAFSNGNDQLSTDTYDYDAFGNLIHSTGTTPNNYLFAGEQFDPDLGLYYNRARYLNTSTGRFWSMDSFEGDGQSPLSLNLYLYSNANAVDTTDPSGNEGIDDALGSFSVSDTLNNSTHVRPLNGFPKPRGVSHFGHLSNHGAGFIASWEDSSLFPYNDSSDYCTIGVGHLLHMSPCDGSEFPSGITPTQELQFFRDDLIKFQFEVNLDVRVPLSQGEFDSLVSLTFNIGGGAFRSSSLLKYLNQGSYFVAERHFLDYVYARNPKTQKKEVSNGLVRRRSAERLIFDFETYLFNKPVEVNFYGLFF